MRRIRVASLNIHMMGHVTYQTVLEKIFRESISEIDFLSLNHLQKNYSDFFGEKMYALLTLRIPFLRKNDRDLFRLRAELAMSFMANRRVNAFLKEQDADVVHLHTQALGLLAPGAFGGRPYVISLDNTTALLLEDRDIRPRWLYAPLVALERKCFKSAAHVVSFTERARQSVIRDYGIEASKVSVNYPSIPLEPLISVPRTGLKREKIRLLFVGNDFHRKGGTDLLSVFQSHLQDSCELDIVSNDVLDLPPLPNIRHHRGLKPLSPEILKRYEEADIFVMPTREDCIGWVYIEANAAGLPSVATAVMAVPEVVRNGLNGFTVAVGDKSGLARAIQNLVEDNGLRQQMGLRARELARAEFDPEINYRNLAKIFISAADKRS